MNKKVKIISVIIFISVIFITLRVLGQDNHYEKSFYIFVKKWGTKGYGDGQFGELVVMPGSTYIITDKTIDDLKNLINKNKLETLISLKNKEFVNINECYYTLENLNFSKEECCWIIMEAAVLKGVGTKNIGPLFIAVDKFNNVYVSDIDKAQIQKFDSEGNFLTKWGRGGSGKGQFSSLYGLAVDSECYVYALDRGNGRIQKFDSNGNFILQWSGIYGSSDGYFASTTGIAVSPDDYIYINNKGTNLQKFDANGKLIKEWPPSWNPHKNEYCNEFDRSMAIDKDNNLFILTYESRSDKVIHKALCPYIRKTDLTTCSDIWGEEIFGGEKYNGIVDFALDSEGNIFVLYDLEYVDEYDSECFDLYEWGSCVYKIAPDGSILTKWGSSGSGDGEFNSPDSIAVDSDGNVYVMDTGNYRIQKFAPNPEFKTNN